MQLFDVRERGVGGRSCRSGGGGGVSSGRGGAGKVLQCLMRFLECSGGYSSDSNCARIVRYFFFRLRLGIAAFPATANLPHQIGRRMTDRFLFLFLRALAARNVVATARTVLHSVSHTNSSLPRLIEPGHNWAQAGLGDTFTGKIQHRSKTRYPPFAAGQITDRGPLQPAAKRSDYRAAGGVLFFRRLQQVLALDAQPHGYGRCDEYR